MPINPGIALGIQPSQAPDLFGSVGKALQLRGLITQQENMAADRDYKLSELLQRKKLQNLQASLDPGPKGDADRIRNEVQFGDPERGQNMREKLRKQHEELRGQAGYAIGLLDPQHRAMIWPTARQQLEAQGVDVSGMPAEYPGDDVLLMETAKWDRNAAAQLQEKFAVAGYWSGRQQAAIPAQSTNDGFAPGSAPEIKPMQEGIAYSQDDPNASLQINAPKATTTGAVLGDANNPEMSMQAAAEFDRRGLFALAEKEREKSRKIEKGFAETAPKDLGPRIMRELNRNPKMPDWQRRAYLDTLGNSAGIPDDFQYEITDGKLLIVPREQVAAAKKARAPTTNVTVNTGDKAFDATVGKVVGETFGNDYQAAKAAQESLVTTIAPLKRAFSSDKVLLGPTATLRMGLLRAGSALNITGKNDDEVLAQTRQAIKGLASISVQTAALLKGQGQITEKERELIEQAASGKIDTLSPPELKILIDALEKAARYKIKQHGQNMDRMKNQPGMENIGPMMRIDAPDEPTVGAQAPSFRSLWK